jgi:hypothetical protein
MTVKAKNMHYRAVDYISEITIPQHSFDFGWISSAVTPFCHHSVTNIEYFQHILTIISKTSGYI